MSDPSGPATPTPKWTVHSEAKPEPGAASFDLVSSPIDVPTTHGHNRHREEAKEQTSRTQRAYKARTCRICFEEVEATLESPSLSTQYLGVKPRVRYVSEDAEMGRLMRPCKCKGSQKYVHEGCLRTWRRAAAADRNLWLCPTCKHEYKLQRLTWARWLTSRSLRVFLTAAVMVLTVFILGFVADPIINLWIDPAGVVVDVVTGGLDGFDDFGDWMSEDEEQETWIVHFSKGIFSLGLVGLVKTLFGLGPLSWWNIRTGGGNRRGGRGRDRIENLSWTLVLIGVITFLGAAWKAVSAVCERFLEKFSDQIVDVSGGDSDSDDEYDEKPRTQAKKD